MSLLNKLQNWLFGEDKKTRIGVGFLSIDDPDNEDYAIVHDFGYTEGVHSQETITRDQFDEETFWRFAEKRVRERKLPALQRLIGYYVALEDLNVGVPFWEGKEE